MLLGTADECEARLRQVAADAGLDGCWFTQSPLTPDEDPIRASARPVRHCSHWRASSQPEFEERGRYDRAGFRPTA